MRIKTTKSKKGTSYYIIKDYTNIDGKRTTKIYEKLGNQDQIKERFGFENTMQNILDYIHSLEDQPLPVYMNPNKQIEKGNRRKFNIGYLFLKNIYYSLGLHQIFHQIQKKYQFKFDLNEVLECLIYARILWPCSKLSTYHQADKFVEKKSFEYQHVLRALSYLAKEFDEIQKNLFVSSSKVLHRNYRVIYYDCTNFFFYTDENEFQKYGISKQHQPLPLIQMGLFMDANGIPIALNINPGNTNESKTMIPLEKKILEEFELDSKNIVVCTDAAMCTDDIKKFNVKDGRGFVITQSIKKLNQDLKNWALDPEGWRIVGNLKNTYNLKEIEQDENLKNMYFNKIFYKEIECETKSVKQTLIVTFSFKYQAWQKAVKLKQFERANKIVEEINAQNQKAKNKKEIQKIKITKNPNDPRRFIQEYSTTEHGEIADYITYTINTALYNEEEKYNGFYGITTNLNNDTETVIKVIHGRWEIEESFRILKEEFDSNNVYLSREDRIRSHFLICFLALFEYRVLEKKLDNKYTVYEIIDCLRDMEVLEIKGDGYIPTYTRTDLTDDLHRIFGLNTDSEIITYKKFKKIASQIKVK